MSLGRISLLLLCVAGIVLSGYSLYEHELVTSGIDSGSAACNISSEVNCKGVIQSKWSTFFGIPLGAYGLGFYAFLLVGLLWDLYQKKHSGALHLSFIVASLSIPVSLFLFFISKFVIGILCPVCLLMYVVNALLFIILFFAVRGDEDGLFGVIKSGAGYLSRAPLLVLLGAIVTFGSPSTLKSFIDVEVLKKKLKESFEQRIDGAVTQWRGAKVVDIPASTEPGHLQDYRVGSADAPIQIVEFFDYECPACRNFAAELKGLLERYGDKIALTLRNYPLDQNCNPGIKNPFHQYACKAAVFARCAGEQGRFEDAHNLLIGIDALTDAGDDSLEKVLAAAVEELSLDAVAMQECLVADRQQKKILDDITAADGLGLQSTPSVWINGKKVSSLHPEILTRIFDSLYDQLQK